MLNQVVIAGRLVNDPVVKENEKGKCYIQVAVPRPYKNDNGEYDTDIIECVCYNMWVQTVEYCKKGDIVGVKGRIQNNGDKNEITVEKLSFLSSHKEVNE